MMNNRIIIMCPSYPQYETPPDDQPECELYDCPKCKGKMWLSLKKRGRLLFHSLCKDDILLACYDCISKLAKEEPELFVRKLNIVNI